MSHPTEDELVDLALGDEVRDESISAHVDACDECGATVAELRRAASLVASAPPQVEWQAPGDAVWRRISDQLTTDDLTDNLADNRADGAPDIPSPTATAAPRSLRATPHTSHAGSVGPEASPAAPATPHADDELGTRRTRSGRGRAIGWGVGLAAASLAIGLLAGRAIWQPDASVQPVAQVALSTLDTKQDEGEATVVRAGQGLDLTVATTKPLDAGGGYLEVWLLNSDGKRMVSVGVLAPGEKGSFPISQTMIDDGYVIVDISREKFDDSPAHSGDSLLRGKLPA